MINVILDKIDETIESSANTPDFGVGWYIERVCLLLELISTHHKLTRFTEKETTLIRERLRRSKKRKTPHIDFFTTYLENAIILLNTDKHAVKPTKPRASAKIKLQQGT